MRYININGRSYKDTSAGVPYDSRAVRFGFGLFETMLMVDGQIMLKDLHWNRLYSGIAQLNLVMPELMTREWMAEEVLRTVKKNRLEKLCRIRLQIYAGKGGLFDGQSPWSEFIIDCQPVEASLLQLNEKGLSLMYAEGLAKSADSIANMKTSSAMIYAMGARQAIEKKVDNTIILNTAGNPIETTLANIFCISNDEIYTPSLSEGCIAGVMREHIISELKKNGFSVTEMPITKEFLKNADAVFTTNSIRRIKWVASIEDKQYNIGTILDVYEKVSYTS